MSNSAIILIKIGRVSSPVSGEHLKNSLIKSKFAWNEIIVVYETTDNIFEERPDDKTTFIQWFCDLCNIDLSKRQFHLAVQD